MIVPPPQRRGLGCNNCHQLGYDKRCEKYVALSEGAAAGPSQQRRGTRGTWDEVEDISLADRDVLNHLSKQMDRLIERNYKWACDNEDENEHSQVRTSDFRGQRYATEQLREVWRELQGRRAGRDKWILCELTEDTGIESMNN